MGPVVLAALASACSGSSHGTAAKPADQPADQPAGKAAAPASPASPAVPTGGGRPASGSSAGGNVGALCPRPSLVRETLGVPAGPTERESVPAVGGRTLVGCSYGEGNGLIAIGTGWSAADFAADKAKSVGYGDKIETVTGVGDEAYSDLENAPLNSLVARKGSLYVGVAATVSVDREKALVKRMFGEL